MRRKKPYHVIDEKIRPQVDALNAVPGVETIASCEGHYSPGDTPYVWFSAPLPFVQALAKVLRDAPEQGIVHAGWHVTGAFDQDYRMKFELRAASYEREAWSLFGQGYRLLFRRRIDADIRCIADRVKQAASEAITFKEPRCQR